MIVFSCLMDWLNFIYTTREKPSSSAGFRYISSAGARTTDTALQPSGSSSVGATHATTTFVSSSVYTTRATTITSSGVVLDTRYC